MSYDNFEGHGGSVILKVLPDLDHEYDDARSLINPKGCDLQYK